MDKEIKSYLSALLSNARDQKKEAGELAIRLETAIAAMQAVNPAFAAEFERYASGQDAAESREDVERSLGPIETAIQGLSRL